MWRFEKVGLVTRNDEISGKCSNVFKWIGRQKWTGDFFIFETEPIHKTYLSFRFVNGKLIIFQKMD